MTLFYSLPGGYAIYFILFRLREVQHSKKWKKKKKNSTLKNEKLHSFIISFPVSMLFKLVYPFLDM